MKLHHFGLIAASLALAAWLVANPSTPRSFMPAHAAESTSPAWVDRSHFEIRSDQGQLAVHASITNPRNATANELFRVSIRGMNGQQRLEASQRISLKPGHNDVVLPMNLRTSFGCCAQRASSSNYRTWTHKIASTCFTHWVSVKQAQPRHCPSGFRWTPLAAGFM